MLNFFFLTFWGLAANQEKKKKKKRICQIKHKDLVLNFITDLLSCLGNAKISFMEKREERGERRRKEEPL